MKSDENWMKSDDINKKWMNSDEISMKRLELVDGNYSVNHGTSIQKKDDD